MSAPDGSENDETTKLPHEKPSAEETPLAQDNKKTGSGVGRLFELVLGERWGNLANAVTVAGALITGLFFLFQTVNYILDLRRDLKGIIGRIEKLEARLDSLESRETVARAKEKENTETLFLVVRTLRVGADQSVAVDPKRTLAMLIGKLHERECIMEGKSLDDLTQQCAAATEKPSAVPGGIVSPPR